MIIPLPNEDMGCRIDALADEFEMFGREKAAQSLRELAQLYRVSAHDYAFRRQIEFQREARVM
jgi:hypothetical protein